MLPHLNIALPALRLHPQCSPITPEVPRMLARATDAETQVRMVRDLKLPTVSRPFIVQFNEEYPEKVRKYAASGTAPSD